MWRIVTDGLQLKGSAVSGAASRPYAEYKTSASERLWSRQTRERERERETTVPQPYCSSTRTCHSCETYDMSSLGPIERASFQQLFASETMSSNPSIAAYPGATELRSGIMRLHITSSQQSKERGTVTHQHISYEAPRSFVASVRSPRPPSLILQSDAFYLLLYRIIS